MEERLALLERLKRKYGPTLADVVAKREALRRELADLERGDERIVELEREHDAARAAFLKAAEALGKRGAASAVDFARQLERILGELAMERTRFEVRFNAEPLAEASWTASGIDAAEFFVSPNPGEELRPLARIVSGGELSRIMLAIKTLTAASRHGFSDAGDRPPSASAPGLIFDEVDAGIGGRVADVVGRKLRTLGSAFQVLCITHLPQIAAYADTHFQIEKRVEAGPHADDRGAARRVAPVEELARMLGGEAISDGLRASAREMLTERSAAKALEAKGESKPKGESERAKAKRGRAKAKAKRISAPAGERERRVDEVGTSENAAPEAGARGGAPAPKKMARKYLIETFGCQMNVHDSERMAGLLEQAGFEATDDAADADVVVINTCSVRERAEEKLYTRLGELRQMAAEHGHDPIVAVAGCVAQQEGEALLKRLARRRRRHHRHPGDPAAADAGGGGGDGGAGARGPAAP